MAAKGTSFLLGFFYESCKLNSREELLVSNREPRYFDFIHQHEEKLNLIYSRWEAQIAKQNAANQSRSLFSKTSHKKTALAGMAIALGSVLVAWQYGTNKVTAWQNQRQLQTAQNAIAANSQQLDQIAWRLKSAAYNNRLICQQPGYVYELSLGRVRNSALANQPRAFISQPNTVSLIRTNLATQRPDAYVRLNPNRNLSYGSIEENHNEIVTKTYSINLGRELENSSLEAEEINRYSEAQSGAIALYEELSSCSGDIGLMPHIPQFPHAD